MSLRDSACGESIREQFCNHLIEHACSCEETLREARKRTKEKKEDPREMAFTPDPLLLLPRSLFFMYPIDWSPILTESIAFQLRWRSILIII